MCKLCGQSNCSASCPNREEEAVGICAGCGQDILSDQDYWQVIATGELVHDDPLCKELYVEHASQEVVA